MLTFILSITTKSFCLSFSFPHLPLFFIILNSFILSSPPIIPPSYSALVRYIILRCGNCFIMLNMRFIPIFFAIYFVDTNKSRIFVLSERKSVKHSFGGVLYMLFSPYFLSVSLNGKIVGYGFHFQVFSVVGKRVR